MDKLKVIQHIQDLKSQGYSVSAVIHLIEKDPRYKKPPSIPTIRKYYAMASTPKDPNENMKKPKAFDKEPYRSEIITCLQNNPDAYISSVYDLLREKHDQDEEGLPGNEQTLRNFVHFLIASGALLTEKKAERRYDPVPELPAGQQALLDFGEEIIKNGVVIYFLCVLMRFSRYLMVFAQDHRFNSAEACAAIYRGLDRIGGKPKELALDQDTVFVVSELAGEVINTQVFSAFLAEQDFGQFVCHKADPESKGPIENSVKFVKTNFFSSRINALTCIEDVNKGLSSWTERVNNRIHQGIYRRPVDMLEIEKVALSPLKPSIYDTLVSSYISVKADGLHHIPYKASWYSVPASFSNQAMYYKTAGGKLYIFDSKYQLVAEHIINDIKGSRNTLAEHLKQPDGRWEDVAARLKADWYLCPEMQHLINGFKREDKRHLYSQLLKVEEHLKMRNPTQQFVARVVNYCCEKYRYKFTQFKSVYDLFELNPVQDIYPETKPNSGAKVSLDIYVDEFARRSKENSNNG